jgi:general L-amino acid transport system substrate-binding protein
VPRVQAGYRRLGLSLNSVAMNGRLPVRAAAGALALFIGFTSTLKAQSRLDLVRKRGTLVCGVTAAVHGFAAVDERGRYSGLDVDVCRAVAAAIFGAADKVRFVDAGTVDGFLRSTEIDLVSRRLTWSLQREGLGLLFGPVTFYDGQGFMVPRARKIKTPLELANARICIVPGTVTDYNLNAYFQSRGLSFRKVPLKSHDQADGEFSAGRCDALTADLSELGSVRSRMAKRDAFEILPELISKEPMAPIVRQGDDQFFNVLRWTVFALIAAEELGITSANVMEKAGSADLDVKRFLGVVPGNGRALGLDEAWAANVIKAVGNYGEIFERNVGRQSPIGFERGLNGLWTGGGLMYAPLLRQ